MAHRYKLRIVFSIPIPMSARDLHRKPGNVISSQSTFTVAYWAFNLYIYKNQHINLNMKESPMPGTDVGKCPKCSSKLTNPVECNACGIIFEKYFQVEKRRNETPKTASDVSDVFRGSRNLTWAGLCIVIVFSVFAYVGIQHSSSQKPADASIPNNPPKNPIRPKSIESSQENETEDPNSKNPYYETVNGREMNNGLSQPTMDNPGTDEAEESLDYEYYDVHDDSNKSLKQLLFDYSPIKIDGKTYHGLTTSHINWFYKWYENKSGYSRLTGFKTVLKITITLPRLIDSSSQKRTDYFDNYVKILTLHEMGHVDLSRKAAVEIRSRVLSLDEKPSLGILRSAVENTGTRIWADYHEKSVQYDNDTEHGKTQGAWLY
jgi:predicted secreted Zn-dependent protease